MPPGHCGSAAQTTARTPVVATRPAKDERVLQDALGLIDSPLPGASWHTDALTAASFFVSSRLFLTGGCLLLPHRPCVGEYFYKEHLTSIRRDLCIRLRLHTPSLFSSLSYPSKNSVQFVPTLRWLCPSLVSIRHHILPTHLKHIVTHHNTSFRTHCITSS